MKKILTLLAMLSLSIFTCTRCTDDDNKTLVFEPASPKQISYLLSLASKRGITPSQIAAQQNVANIDRLSRRQCSALIEQWRAA